MKEVWLSEINRKKKMILEILKGNNDLGSCRTFYLRESKLLSTVINIFFVYIRHYIDRYKSIVNASEYTGEIYTSLWPLKLFSEYKLASSTVH